MLEDRGGQSHVAIVAKALGIAAVGNARGVMERVDQGNPIIVDAESGEVHIRPSSEVIAAYGDKARFRARRHRKYRALRDRPAVTKDGQRIELHINAGLLMDVPHLAESGADGIGLFRTELQFMVSATLPRLERQIADVPRGGGGGRAASRWCSARSTSAATRCCPTCASRRRRTRRSAGAPSGSALDRPGLLRTQVRALLRATAGLELRLLLPMVTAVGEVDMARALIDRELDLLRRRGTPGPTKVLLGVMIEVPSLLYELDALLPRVDFVSVGSNDLLQYFFAADRNNTRVAGALRCPVGRARCGRSAPSSRRPGAHDRPLSLCGEMAGRPLEAMALIGLGYRSISMAPASVGPVKSMILSLDAGELQRWLRATIRTAEGSVRAAAQALRRGARRRDLIACRGQNANALTTGWVC